jgi:ADP-ribose pyrophosphatase YjhB (NUDIX family)
MMESVIPQHHAGLTADVFVVRAGKFLALERGPGLGEGVWYLPGGLVERGEDPIAAAIRETREETGLKLEDVRLLRVWTYGPPGETHHTVHATYVAVAPTGEVSLSAEHTAFGWMTPSAYIAQWCNEELESFVPEWAGWIREVRANCTLLEDELRASANERRIE